jgi:hypothetical protein
MTGRMIGNKRNDRRKAKLPKNEEKRAKAIAIREFALNNGCSIKVAKAYFEQEDDEQDKP